jgi:hypothetical protein
MLDRYLAWRSAGSVNEPPLVRVESESWIGYQKGALAERIEVGLFTAEPGRDALDAKHVIIMERRPIRSGAQVLRFVTDRRPTHAGIDPYNYDIDRNSRNNVLRLVDPG